MSQLHARERNTAQQTRAGGRLAWKPPTGTLVLFFASVLIVLEHGKGRLTIESEVEDVAIRITQGGEPVDRLTVSRSGTSVRLAAGSYVVTLDGAAEGITIDDGKETMQRGGREVVRIVVEGDPPSSRATAKSDRQPVGESRAAVRPAHLAGIQWLELLAMDDDGTNLRRIADCGDFTMINSPEISPDGRFVAVDGWRADQILHDARVLIIEVATSETTDLCQGAMPIWSPHAGQKNCSHPTGKGRLHKTAPRTLDVARLVASA